MYSVNWVMSDVKKMLGYFVEQLEVQSSSGVTPLKSRYLQLLPIHRKVVVALGRDERHERFALASHNLSEYCSYILLAVELNGQCSVCVYSDSGEWKACRYV